MSYYLTAIKLAVTLFVVQSVLVPYVSIGNAQPDLMLLLAAAYGFYRGPVAGAGMGFGAGFLQDLLTTQVFGTQALTKCIAGYACGSAKRTLAGESIIWHASAGFLVSFLGASAHYFVLFIVGFEIPTQIGFLEVIIPSAIYNAAVAVFFFRAVERMIEPRSEFARAV